MSWFQKTNKLRSLSDEVSSHRSQEQLKSGQISKLEWAVFYLTLFWVVSAVVLWIRNQTGENALTLFGTTVTVVGAALAFTIYKAQGRQSDQFQDLTLGKLDTMGARVELIVKTQKPIHDEGQEKLQGELQAESAGNAEPVPPDEGYIDEVAERAMTEHGVDMEGHRILDQKYVPLKVIANLVQAWDAMGEKGDWSVENLLGTSRKKIQGNPSWYVFFLDSKHQVVTWRLSSGGKGKSEPTATRMIRV